MMEILLSPRPGLESIPHSPTVSPWAIVCRASGAKSPAPVFDSTLSFGRQKMVSSAHGAVRDF
jgi:hypothetical protein